MAKNNKYYSNIEPHLDEVKEMKEKGATDKQIASFLNVSYASFQLYKKQYKALSDALNKGANELCRNLRGKLYELAMGQTYLETTTITNPDGTCTIKEVEKVVLPSQGAIERLLANYDEEFVLDTKDIRDRKDKELEIKEKNSEKEEW